MACTTNPNPSRAWCRINCFEICADKPFNARNGYTFNDFNHAGIESALHRAIGLWYSYPNHFHELMVNGMRYDYSCNYPGHHHLNVYEYLRDK